METLIRILLAPFNWAGEKLASVALGGFHVPAPTSHGYATGSYQAGDQSEHSKSWSMDDQSALAAERQATCQAPLEAERWPQHSMNVDGTPMVGNVDMNGNPYGLWDSHADWSSSAGSSSMFDSLDGPRY